MPENHERPGDEALQAPPGLTAAFKRLRPETIFVPPAVDEAVLRAAREHLRPPERPRFRWARLMPWVAATAAVTVLVWVPISLRQRAGRPIQPAGLVREDLNHDGRVDILDAFALARQLKAGAAPNFQSDLNGDGLVDERDVAALAAEAVRLDKGGRS